MRGLSQKRGMDMAELNIDYYISLLENASLWKGEGTRTKEFFLDKWHQLLTRKEYDYQYMHINSLCEGFDLLIRKQGKESILVAQTVCRANAQLLDSRIALHHCFIRKYPPVQIRIIMKQPLHARAQQFVTRFLSLFPDQQIKTFT